MKKLTLTSVFVVLTSLLFTVPASATLAPSVEKALQQVCYSSASDRLYQFRKTVKAYRLNMKSVANKVVCNGEDIGSFAAEQGAYDTAQYIRKHQGGQVKIHELVSVSIPLPANSKG